MKYFVVTGVIFALLAIGLFVLPIAKDRTNISLESFDPQSNSIIVKNNGVNLAESFDVYVDEVKVDAVASPIGSGQTGEIYINGLITAGTHKIKIASGNYVKETVVNVPETWVAQFEIIPSV